jgi:predicted amidohydrolase
MSPESAHGLRIMDLHVGVYQGSPLFGEVERNVEQAVRDLRGTGVDLVVLPELFNTGYQFVSRNEVEELAEEVPEGRTTQSMMDLASSENMVLVFGLAERSGRRCHNAAVVVGPSGFLGIYRKVHLFREEKYFFDTGEEGFQVYDVGKARIGVMICFDWLFPESARILALLGADLICHPANLVLPHCQKAMVTRSLENGVYSATANRVGKESRGGKEPLLFTGMSQIVDPEGRVLASMTDSEPGVSIVPVDVSMARNKKITPENDRLADRRPDLYKPLLMPSH